MTMSWTKALADLRAQPIRVALLWFAILIGSLAVMGAFGARVVLEREIAESYTGSRPAAVVVWTDQVDEALLELAAAIEGVQAADARRLVRARVDVGVGGWRSLLLYGVRDFDNIKVSRIYPGEGQWPPSTGSVLIEQSATSVVQSQLGRPISIRVPGGANIQELTVSGITHDPARAPGWQDNLGYAYVTSETLSQLGLDSRLDELHIDVEGDRDQARAVAARVQGLMAASGRPVYRIEVPPRKHPHADHMQAMLLLLQVLAALSLLLSALLAINLFAAMLARQARQIAVMKTLGGRPRRIAGIYIRLAAMIAGTATPAGAVLGVVVAQQFSRFAGSQLNLYDQSVSVPLWLVVVVAGVGVIVPITAALIPIRRATQMSVREALQDVGIQWSGTQRAARSLAVIPVALRLSVRNSFRRRARFALTVASFAVGGAMLMTAANVYRSLIGAVDASLENRVDDVEVRFLRPAPAEDMVAAMSGIDGVEHVEAWGAVLAGFSLPSLGANEPAVAGRYGLLAPPGGDIPSAARLIQGQWGSAESDTIEIAVNRQLLALEPHLAVGAETTVSVGSRVSPARVVGVVEEIAPASAYVTLADMARVLGASGIVGGARLTIGEGVEVSRVAADLESLFIAKDWFPVYLMSRAELRAAMVEHFLILLVVLLVLAAAAIVVGVLGLSSTVGINVLERQREIGVTKSMGASGWAIRRLVLVEGASTTAVSIVLALILSVPLSAFVGYIVGSHGLHVSLPYRTSPEAILLWVVVASVATVIACLGPAERAARTSVRELIAYE